MKKIILKALNGNSVSVPPIWLMRQAGRYLPEYRAIRKAAGGFLEMCYNPELASEVTLQPIRRFGFDAAIIFSDILVIPHAMGVSLDYLEGEGPVLGKVDSKEAITTLKIDNIEAGLFPVFEALRLTKKGLPDETTLVGFAGAPWTVATYMIEGKGSKDNMLSKKFAYENPALFTELMDILTEATIEYLSLQCQAGAEVVQIFDSWAGVLPEKDFYEYSIKPIRKITEAIKKKHPEVYVIGFPKGAGLFYENFVKETGVDGVGIDFTVPIKWAAEVLQPHVCIQGNLDPVLLACNKRRMIDESKRLIDTLGKGAFIFNLGHGILPFTPIENVELLLETIRG